MLTATAARPADYAYPKPALAILFLLYVSQGLPYGFQQMALPLLLREKGASLTVIGFIGFLGTPWLLKFLWAPLLDRHYLPWLGRRKSWIIPTQLCLIATIVGIGAYGMGSIPALLVAVLLMNLFAATQDVAVDGFAIDTLKPHALGLGNTAQVVGYKVGMVLTGGILLSLTHSMGWGFLFTSMAIISFLPFLPLPFFKEQPPPPWETAQGADAVEKKPTFREIVKSSTQRIADPEIRWAIWLILTCKIGEELITSMFNTFLYDGGITKEQIGLWIGTYGMAASVTGSLIGGLLIARFRIWSILGLSMTLRVVPVAMQWWLTQTAITPESVICITVFEHLAAGMLTTALFTFMMSLVNKRAGATEYTFLACLSTLGKAPAVVFSGLIADHLGYALLFFAGLMCCILSLIPWWKCRSIIAS